MQAVQFESAFQNPYIAALIGAAVSLDVVALTFCSSRIYSGNARIWFRWAKYNACWHAGMLLIYLVAIDILTVASQYLGVIISIPLPPWLEVFEPVWLWISDKFRTHFIVYAALAAMIFVWWQYSRKVIAVPTEPDVRDAPIFLQPIFRRLRAAANDPDSRLYWHLSASLVAVDMLALAAVVKSGEKLIQFPRGFDKFEGSMTDLNQKIADSFNIEFLLSTIFVALFVFLIVGSLCFFSAFISKLFWKRISEGHEEINSEMTAIFIVISLRLLEPIVIFYFIIHAMAFLSTGVPVHNPRFLLGSGFLVAALIQYVGFAQILDSARRQVAAPVRVPDLSHA